MGNELNKKLQFFLFITLILFGTAASIFATDIHFVTGVGGQRIRIPRAYNVIAQINNIGEFEGSSNQYFRTPADIFVDSNDYIYIVDTGNNRIVKLDPDLNTAGTYYGPPNNGFSQPQGIFVDDFGSMFVADTGNNRIVHLSADGSFIDQYVNPESDAVGSAPFTPTSLLVNNTGLIMAVRGETIMILDANNEFRGLFGRSRIGFNVTEAMLRIFATENQLRFMSRRLAPSFIDIHLGYDNMIYATSLNRAEGEVKRLNSVGNNTFRTYGSLGDSGGNPITNFINSTILRSGAVRRQFRFGEYFDDEGNFFEPVFAGITTDRSGIVTVVEENSGRIYQYDQDGILLAAFGGRGQQIGLFNRPSAIAVDSRGRLFVTDRAAHNFQVFEPTEFILTVHGATTAFQQGMYDESYMLWNRVLEMNENYEMAHLGISRVYYKLELWKEAMDRAILANDPVWYSRAFEEFRYETMRNNFGLIVVLILALIAGLYFFIKYFGRAVKKSSLSFMRAETPKMKIPQGLLFSSNILMRPVETLETISVNRDRLNLFVPVIILLLAYLIQMSYLMVVHYPLATINTADVNVFFEMVKMWIVPLTWVIASFAVSSIANGESKVKEIFFASSLALLPFIFINTPMMFVSHVLSDAQRSWFGIFGSLSTAWAAFILFMGLKVLNSYDWKEAIKLALITVFVMLVIWIVGGMIYVLIARLIQFILGVVLEFRMLVF